jgi:hypothetical protein
VELVVEPKSDRLEAADPRWRDQVVALFRDLRLEDVNVQTRSTPVAGEKGATTEIVLALGSSGAIAAVVTTFQAWLARDRTRSLDITWEEGDRRRFVSINADDVDADVFEEIARASARDLLDPQ